MREQHEAPTHDPFEEAVIRNRPFENAKERLTVVPERLFVARQPDNSGPSRTTLRQYYRETYDASGEEDYFPKAEIAIKTEGKLPSFTESIKFSGENQKDFFQIRIDGPQELIIISSRINSGVFEAGYHLNTGKFAYLSITETGSAKSPNIISEKDLKPLEMYNAGQKTVSVSHFNSTNQLLKMPIGIDNRLIEKNVDVELLHSPMTADTGLDREWKSVDWQNALGIYWSVNGKPVNIAESLK